MQWNVSERSWYGLNGRVKQQWGKFVDAGLDTIAGWRDRSAGAIHATYGVTNLQAKLQRAEFEHIRSGFPLPVAA